MDVRKLKKLELLLRSPQKTANAFDMDLSLETWIPCLFPGIEWGVKKRQTADFFTGEEVYLNYREACLRLFEEFLCVSSRSVTAHWGADFEAMPQRCKISLFFVDAALEYRWTQKQHQSFRHLQKNVEIFDVSLFLKKWIPLMFPRLKQGNARKKKTIDFFTGEEVCLNYREACLRLFEEVLCVSGCDHWGADFEAMPRRCKTSLYFMDVALEYWWAQKQEYLNLKMKKEEIAA
jgi:hypothetical protein